MKRLRLFAAIALTLPTAALALDPEQCAYYTAKLKRSARNADDAGQAIQEASDRSDRRDALSTLESELQDVERYLLRARRECEINPVPAALRPLPAPASPGKSEPRRGP